jgi:hypothetical protein
MTPTPLRARRAAAAALLGLAVVAGAACAQDGGGAVEVGGPETDGGADAGRFEATATYLAEAGRQSSGEGHRVEVLVALGEEVPEDAAPMVTGTVDGDRFAYHYDLGPMMEELGEAFGESTPLPDIDLTMEMMGDADTWYLRAPLFSDIALQDGTADLADALADLGDRWGRIDVGALDDIVPGEVQAALAGNGVDPAAALELLQDTEGVEEIGTDELRGETVHGLRAEVTLGDVIATSGVDPETYAETIGQGGASEGAVQALYDLPVPMEAWVDDQGYLRRLEYGFGLADVTEAMGVDTAELDDLGIGDLRYAYAVDMYDYGATVSFDEPADAVDITDAFAQLSGG